MTKKHFSKALALLAAVCITAGCDGGAATETTTSAETTALTTESITKEIKENGITVEAEQSIEINGRKYKKSADNVDIYIEKSNVDLSIFSELKNLKSIDIYIKDKAKNLDFKSLCDIPTLEHIAIYDLQEDFDFSGIEKMTNINSLHLATFAESVFAVNYQGFEKLNLKELCIKNLKLESSILNNLQSLEKITAIRSMNYMYGWKDEYSTDWDYYSDIDKLTAFVYIGNYCEDLDSENDINQHYTAMNKDFQGLANLKKLKELTCEIHCPSDLTFVSELTMLEKLSITGVGNGTAFPSVSFKNASALKKLPNLKDLYLSGTDFENYDFISELSSVKKMSLSRFNNYYSTLESDWSFLYKMVKLEELQLYMCDIDSIEFINYMNLLKHLKIQRTNITDYTAVKENNSLLSLVLSENSTFADLGYNYDKIALFKKLQNLQLNDLVYDNNIESVKKQIEALKSVMTDCEIIDDTIYMED